VSSFFHCILKISHTQHIIQYITGIAVIVLSLSLSLFKVLEVVDVRLNSPNYFEVTYPHGVISFQMYFKGQSYTTFNTRYITPVISCVICCVWLIFKIHLNNNLINAVHKNRTFNTPLFCRATSVADRDEAGTTT